MRAVKLGLALISTALAGFGPAPTGSAETRALEAAAPAHLDPGTFDVKSEPAGAAMRRSIPVGGYLRARWLVRQGRLFEALKELDRQDPNDVFRDRLLLLRGDALLGQKRFHEAQAAYQQALRSAQCLSVAKRAARGWLEVLSKIGEPKERLGVLDFLLDEEVPDPELGLERARNLKALGWDQEARDVARTVLAGYPSVELAARAERFLLSLASGRKEAEEIRVAAGVARAWWHSRRGRRLAAVRELEGLRRRFPRAGVKIELELADVHREHDARWRAEALVSRLAQRRDLGEARADVLLRQARLAMDRYAFPRALAAFAECAATGAKETASSCAFEGAKLAYLNGAYQAAAEGMLALAQREARSPMGEEALWYGGWSAYLAGSSSVAVSAFRSFLDGHPTSQRQPAVAYWLARARERLGQRDLAVAGYEGVVRQGPLAFYGAWARQRLDALGVNAHVAASTPAAAPVTFSELAQLLGPNRPVSIDRAAALFEARLISDGVEEVLGAIEHYQKAKDPAGVTLSLDLLQLFDREAWLPILARAITEGDAGELTGNPEFWRVWRYAYPTPFPLEVEAASRDHHLDPSIVYAVMRTESRFRPDAVSPKGARGLMQLMPATAFSLGREGKGARRHAQRYRQPASNIWLGTRYIAGLLTRYAGRTELAVGAYNAGPRAMDRWMKAFGELEPDEMVERAPYDETRRYMQRTIEALWVYRALYQGLPPGGGGLRNQPGPTSASAETRSRSLRF